jgi:G:T-mismatch repair DNA endonuclease (very short patch repair protein)
LSWKDNKYKEQQTASHKLYFIKNPEAKINHSKRITCKWQDPEYVAKQMKARNVRPNKLELNFEKLLNKIQPNEWKYVGDGEFILGGKCPDFVNINGKKQIIELYGDYWHKGQNPQERIGLFSEFGYRTLVIWENELKNIEEVEDKIKIFVEEIKICKNNLKNF